MKKLLILGLAVLCIKAQVVDNQTAQYVATTAAAIAPYAPPAVAVTPGAAAIIPGVTPGVNTVTGAPAVTAVVPLTLEQRQALELHQINAELAQFYAVQAHQPLGAIDNREWLRFSSGLVARHPEILELRTDRPAAGRTYLRFANPNYLYESAVSPWVRVYIKPHVVAPINPYP